MANLSLQNLYDLTDDAVGSQVYSVFLAQLESAPSVQSTFFSSAGAPACAAVDSGWVDRVATALVCSSIARSSLFNFANTVSGQAATAFWKAQLAVGSAKAVQASQSIYDWAFPAFAQAGGATFQDYLNNNPASWAQQFSAHVTSGSFINTTVAKLLAQDPDWLRKLNLVFYKINRLDNTQVQGVVNAWQSAFPNAAIDVVWQTYNFVPDTLFQPDQFLSMVNAAISVKTEIIVNSRFGTGSYIYGSAVEDFLGGTPATMGLATKASADNVKSQSGGGCFLAGTRVHLHDGSHLPIEQVSDGHKVLAQGGTASRHTAEEVVTSSPHPVPVYGINQMTPFFSAGHLFWTRQGWKAVDPSIADDENPGRCAGKLQVGDTVYRLRSVDPLEYEEVVIADLPMEYVDSQTPLHGLHLAGEPSYHANGFLVAMNYPVITEKRLRDAFARMTSSERKLIARQMEPIVPLLAYGIGSFIEGALDRSLRGDS